MITAGNRWLFADDGAASGELARWGRRDDRTAQTWCVACAGVVLAVSCCDRALERSVLDGRDSVAGGARNRMSNFVGLLWGSGPRARGTVDAQKSQKVRVTVSLRKVS